MLFLRTAPLLLIPLGVVYVSLYGYFCASYRARLTDQTIGLDAATIARRVEDYAIRLRLRLAAWVFGLPLAALALIMLWDIL